MTGLLALYHVPFYTVQNVRDTILYINGLDMEKEYIETATGALELIMEYLQDGTMSLAAAGLNLGKLRNAYRFMDSEHDRACLLGKDFIKPVRLLYAKTAIKNVAEYIKAINQKEAQL